MLEYRTQGFQGYAVKYSPWFDNKIAVAASANYGLVGNGRLYVLELTPNGLQPLKWYVKTHLTGNSISTLTGTLRTTLYMTLRIQKHTHPIF